MRFNLTINLFTFDIANSLAYLVYQSHIIIVV